MPSVIGVPSGILLGIALCAFSFIVLRPVHIGRGGGAAALGAAGGCRGRARRVSADGRCGHTPRRSCSGFLVLENAVSVASLVIAPGLPLILALLLLFDVLVGVLVFVVLVQYLGDRAHRGDHRCPQPVAGLR